MGKILCATRGGERSYRAQDAAIALAQERGDDLVFLYVVDLHFLDKTAGAGVVDVASEMTKMGQFLLVMARERAEAAGVQAETVSYQGEVREEIINAARREGVSLVLLGKPAETESVFELAGLQALAAEIEAETGVETRLV
jgi:nucleotide-binding universal stress UspA family protein